MEVCIVAFVAGPSCEDAVGELEDVGVIGLDRVVVAFTSDGDTVFSAGQFVLEAEKVFVGFQLRIIFDDGEKATESAVKLPVGGNFV